MVWLLRSGLSHHGGLSGLAGALCGLLRLRRAPLLRSGRRLFWSSGALSPGTRGGGRRCGGLLADLPTGERDPVAVGARHDATLTTESR